MAKPADSDDPGAPKEDPDGDESENVTSSEQVNLPGKGSFSDQVTVRAQGGFSDQITVRAWRDPQVQGDEDPPGSDSSDFDDVLTGELSFASLPDEEVAKTSGAPPAQAPSVVDVDTTPADRRPTGLMDPWQTSPPGVSIEAEIVQEIVADSRRPTVGMKAEPRSLRWKIVFGLVGAIGVILAGLAAGQMWRSRQQEEAGPPTPREAPQLEPQPVAAPSMPEAEPGAVASEPEATGEERRRAIRRKLFAAFADEKFDDAVELGSKLETEHRLDWEAEFLVAEAHRLAGNTRIALRRYQAYCSRYRSNIRADDAHFWAAEILRLTGQTKAAKRHYGIVAANRRSNLRAAAKRRLRGL